MSDQFKPLLVCSAAIGAAFWGAALADVTVHRITQFSGIGGVGASEMTSTEHIKGLMKREESTHRFTGSILSRLTNESQDASIYRLDKEVIWQLDPAGKRYTEQPIQSISEMLANNQSQQSAQSGAPAAAGSEPEPNSQQNPPDMKITRNEVNVTKTGRAEKKNGFPCDEYTVEWIVEAEDANTGSTVTNTMTTVLWTTPEKGELKQLRKEETAYNQEFAKKMNLQLSPEEQQQYGLPAAQALLGSMDTQEFADKMSKIEGYPIVVDVTWRTAGDEQTQAANAQNGSSQPAETMPDMGDIGSIAKGVGSLFGGLMGKPKTEPQPAAAKDDTNPGEVIFQSRTEVTKVEVSALDETLFEVPGNYTKQ